MQNNSSKTKLVLLRLFATFLILLGYGLIVMPVAIDWYARIGQTATISSYKNEVDKLNDQQKEEQFEKCFEYNDLIAQKHEDEFYRYKAEFDYDDTYLSLPLENSQEIATVIIPKIGVNLSIGHGTEDDLLQEQAGHLYGTSLPVGGKSSHSVIAAHSALRSAEMFTRLDELELGDEIIIEVLGERHRYIVDEINVVLPDQCDELMQIIPNEDLITLYTCTPYGINTHRLLVRASRGEDPTETSSGINMISISTNNSTPIFMLLAIVGLPVILAIGLNCYWYVKDTDNKTKVRKVKNNAKQNC